MTKDNVLAVADAIEAQRFPRLGFNMRWLFLKREPRRPDEIDMSGHDCGTVACIAGWALAVKKGSQPRNAKKAEGEALITAEEYLGLNQYEAHALFFPPERHERDITPSEAVAVLRHLAETGEVDWSVAPVAGLERVG
jgi:hypothetical protein